MCAICNMTQLPVCPTGMACGINLQQIVAAAGVIGASGIGTAKLWWPRKEKKLNGKNFKK